MKKRSTRPDLSKSFLPTLSMLATALCSGTAAADNGQPGIWNVQWQSPLPEVQPIANIRASFVYTTENTITVTGPDGQPMQLSSTKMDPSPFGHRDGFVLENAEIGLKGRFKDYGLYYQLKAELVPREKDGNRSSDYLKDAYFGWNKYNWMDLAVGRMKVPFSQANMKPTEQMNFIYPPTLDVLTQKRQLGIKVSGGDPWEIFKLTGGIYNSVALATEQMKSLDQLLYVVRGDFRIDNILKAAKVEQPKWLGFKWNIGVDFMYTDKNYDPPTTNRWIGFDTHLDIWRFTFEAEYVLKDFYTGDIKPDGSQTPDRGWGWHADLVVHIFPGKWDIMGRWEIVDGDEEVRGAGTVLSIDELSKQKHQWMTLGTIVYFTPQTSFYFNYIQRRQLEGYRFNTDEFVAMFQYSM